MMDAAVCVRLNDPGCFTRAGGVVHNEDCYVLQRERERDRIRYASQQGQVEIYMHKIRYLYASLPVVYQKSNV